MRGSGCHCNCKRRLKSTPNNRSPFIIRFVRLLSGQWGGDSAHSPHWYPHHLPSLTFLIFLVAFLLSRRRLGAGLV